MSNRIVESLYRVSGASFNEGVEEVSMLNTSKFGSVVSKLQDKFGQSFNEKPICSEVCEFLEKAVPQFDKVECAVFIKDGTDFIPISSHHSVIKFGDKILDFTNQQYDNHSEYFAVSKKENNISLYDNDTIKNNCDINLINSEMPSMVFYQKLK